MRFIRGNNQRPPLTRRQQALAFWGVVLIVCLCGGAASFAAGRYYLGKKLRDVEARTPKNVFPGKAGADNDASSSGKSDPDAITPPEKAIVRIEAREPNPGEKSDAEEEHGKKSHSSKRDRDESKSGSGESTKRDSSDTGDKTDGTPKSDDGGGAEKKSKVLEGGPIE